MTKLALLMVLAPVVAGCASAQATSPADRPNLDVPAPPPRQIESRAAYAAPPPESEPDLPTASPSVPRPRPVPTAEVPPPATPPAVQPSVPQLRTPGTADGAEAARQIEEMIQRARRTLESIDYRPLNPQRRAQYDSAKLMITQSQDALKSQNYGLAKGLADKADRIAKELQGR